MADRLESITLKEFVEAVMKSVDARFDNLERHDAESASLHGKESNNIVRMHEQRMCALEGWCNKLEKKVDKIPWILFLVTINVLLTVATILLRK